MYERPIDRLRDYVWPTKQPRYQEVAALDEVTLDIPAGSSLGIIGENGSGKSTLLGILAGVVTPSRGTVRTQGRVSAILELGTGFNPEFTGRENVLMYGAILGMTEREMERRFPEIMEFAEIGSSIERSVKTYSSGMFVRLAFAVATSVDPDLFIIDEALAVGDQYFQKKCIDRIGAFKAAGKTIVFCSHNLYQVRNTCDQAVWLRDGRVALQGDAGIVTEAYDSYLRTRIAQGGLAEEERYAATAGGPRIVGVELLIEGRSTSAGAVESGQGLAIVLRYEGPTPPVPINVGFVLWRNDNLRCYGTSTHAEEGTILSSSSGTVTLVLPEVPLLAGDYYVNAHLLDDTGLHSYDQLYRACTFSVHQSFLAIGVCQMTHRWEIGS